MDPLVSTDELRTFLGHDVAEDVAALAVANASGIVRDFCRWPITAEETTFVCDGTGHEYLNLPTLRLNSVSEVRVDNVALIGPDPLDLAVGDYQWSVGGQVFNMLGWPRRFRCVEVDCVHGHDETPDVVRAVTLVLSARGATNPEGLRSKTVGAVSRSFVFETMRGDLSELQMTQIGGYRLP